MFWVPLHKLTINANFAKSNYQEFHDCDWFGSDVAMVIIADSSTTMQMGPGV